VIKSTPSPLKLAVLIGFVLSCVIVLAYLWINFGGSIPLSPQGYRFEVAFPQANELATGADVRIAGVNVGKVVGLGVDSHDNRTLATIQLANQFAPIPRDTQAQLRLKTLIGETYVELSAGSRSSGRLPDHGRLPDGQVEPDVTLDQILSTFDPTTRRAFQTWMQAQAAAGAGRGEDINASFASLPEFVDSAESLVSALDTQSASVRGVVANTGTFFSTISARRGELSGLISAANHVFETTAQRNQELADLFKALPAFELQSRLTLPALTKFGQNADPVVRALWPIASELDQTFAVTGQLAPEFRGLFERLGPAVSASERGLPAFDSILAHIPPLLQAFEPWLENANPMVRYIGLYKHEITGFFANAAAATQASNLAPPRAAGDKVHFLRTTQTLSPQGLAFLPRTLGITRNEAYRAPGAYNQLASGLEVLNAADCQNGNPAPPSSSDPPGLEAFLAPYVFRTTGRNIAAPSCREQGPIPGFDTLFPQLHAEAPPGMPSQ
jgi:phospholipid/cholesterol/gamma-HCH transport system substrate-binding protein